MIQQNIELPHQTITDLQFNNMQSRQQIFDIVLRMMPVVANSVIQGGIFGPGDYRGGTVSSIRLDGLGWPVITGPVTINGNSIIRGIVFADVITIAASATVAFEACVFQKTITVASGGKGAWAACRFDGTSSIQNGGPAARCAVAGGIHTSSVAHVNVTLPGGEAT